MEKFRKGNGEEVMDFQPRCINVKRRCRSDVLWQIALDTSSDDREGSIADSGESSSADNQWWRRGRVQSLSSLEISWSAEFVDEVRRSQPMQAFVYEDGKFEVNPFSNLQPMVLMKNRTELYISLNLMQFLFKSINWQKWIIAQRTLNKGARTAEPALPYSNALINCGKMLSLQNDVGNKSRDDGRLLKKLFLASWSWICHKKNTSTSCKHDLVL